jgi:hypothetical protein
VEDGKKIIYGGVKAKITKLLSKSYKEQFKVYILIDKNSNFVSIFFKIKRCGQKKKKAYLKTS